MENSFIKLIEEDIKICEEYIYPTERQKEDFLKNKQDYCKILIGRYQKSSNNFPTLSVATGRTSATSENIKLIYGFLTAYKANSYKDFQLKSTNVHSVNNINISNSNENNISITTFSEVAKKIEEMSSLPDEDIEEILQKLNDLELIMNSQERKSKKWESAKEIVKWVLDKGADVAIAFLPLIMQIS